MDKDIRKLVARFHTEPEVYDAVMDARQWAMCPQMSGVPKSDLERTFRQLFRDGLTWDLNSHVWSPSLEQLE